jgi:tetratricopeptide (TPR) repeat protein
MARSKTGSKVSRPAPLPPPPPAPPARRRAALVLALGAPLLAAAALGVALLVSNEKDAPASAPPAAPPEIPQIEERAGLDPSLVAAVESKIAAVERDAANAEAWGDLGRLYHAHGYYDLARRSYEIAERLAPRVAAWPYYLGVLASGRGESKTAIDALGRALALDGNYPATQLRLGNLLFTDGQLEAAERRYGALVLQAPDQAWGYLGRGKVARRQGRLEEAAELLEQAVARAPEDREGSYLLAMTYRELGRSESAQRQLDGLDGKARAWPPDPLMEAIRTGRQDLQSLNRLANRLFAQGDAEGAAAIYRTILTADPEHFDAHYNLGIVQRQQGSLLEAQASFEAAIRSRPESAEAHFALAVTYASRQELAKAADEIAIVLRIDPEHEGARAVLAGRTP